MHFLHKGHWAYIQGGLWAYKNPGLVRPGLKWLRGNPSI